MNMKLLVVLLATMGFFSFMTQRSVFKVEYMSPTQAIVITNTQVVVTEYVESYDNPMSSIPSGRTQVVKKASLTTAQFQALKTKLDKSGFWKLTKASYGASEGERAYAYSISALNGKNTKTVVYKSNPAPETEKMPAAFDAVEKHILDLVKSISNWK